MNSDIRIVFSSQAYLSILTETYAFPERETGGIFLGIVQDNTWYVLEIIDPGYQNTRRCQAFFEYDVTYVNHLANVRRRLYKIPLTLLGLWHRHPGSFDRFSKEDDRTNTRFAKTLPQGAISALINVDPQFRQSVFHVSLPLNYRRITDVTVGDSGIPDAFKRFKDPHDVTEYDIERAPEGEKNSVCLSSGHQPVLDMLESEMDAYLEAQSDYESDIRMVGDTVEMTMHYLGHIDTFPQTVDCVFAMANQSQKITINTETQTYSPGIIERYVNLIRQKNNACKDPKVAANAQVLGLDPPYNEDEIKKAHRKIAKSCHPDKLIDKGETVQKDANAMMQKINAAKDYLIKICTIKIF